MIVSPERDQPNLEPRTRFAHAICPVQGKNHRAHTVRTKPEGQDYVQDYVKCKLATAGVSAQLFCDSAQQLECRWRKEMGEVRQQTALQLGTARRKLGKYHEHEQQRGEEGK